MKKLLPIALLCTVSAGFLLAGCGGEEPLTPEERAMKERRTPPAEQMPAPGAAESLDLSESERP